MASNEPAPVPVPQPQSASSQLEPSSTASLPLQINTYHCLCSNLLLATTYTLPMLPRRASPALDTAFMLPCPRLPRQHSADEEAPSESDSGDEDTRDIIEVADENGHSLRKHARGYTVLLSLSVPPRQPPVLIRRSDGIEKRWMLRCGRCKVAVAYQLDWAQFEQGAGVGGDGSILGKKGKREDVVYVLPGAFMTTSEMKQGKKFDEAEVGFGLVNA